GADRRALTRPTLQSRSAAPIALTSGDPAGVGPELAVKAWTARHQRNLPAFYVIGDADQIAARARRIGLPVPIAAVAAPAAAAAAFEQALPVVRLANRLAERPGSPDPANASGIVESIERAVDDCLAGRAGAVVTNPIAKKALYETGFRFPGHTEF